MSDWNEGKELSDTLRKAMSLLDSEFLGEGCTCDGTAYGCIGCDAFNLKVALERFVLEVEWIDEQPEARKGKERYHRGR